MMTRARPNLQLLRSAALPAACLLVIGYFAFAAVLGQNGILKWGDYRTQLAAKRSELAAVEGEHARLQHTSDLLDPRHVDPDLADAIVRQQTGQVRGDEVIVPIR